jgi:hypothetical protein
MTSARRSSDAVRAQAGLGLYSIGVRGLDAGELLAFARRHRVPFIHLRGGPRGYDLARWNRDELAALATLSQQSTPITIVTADLDLASFIDPGSEHFRRATAELDRLTGAAAILGAGAVRLLARHVLHDAEWQTVVLPEFVAERGLVTLLELHDPGWFTSQAMAGLVAFLDGAAQLALLLDSAQVAEAERRNRDALTAASLAALARCARVVHLCDTGAGLDDVGRRILAGAATTGAVAERRLELAFEWTGADRSPAACLAAYHAAAEWSRKTGESVL